MQPACRSLLLQDRGLGSQRISSTPWLSGSASHHDFSGTLEGHDQKDCLRRFFGRVAICPQWNLFQHQGIQAHLGGDRWSSVGLDRRGARRKTRGPVYRAHQGHQRTESALKRRRNGSGAVSGQPGLLSPARGGWGLYAADFEAYRGELSQLLTGHSQAVQGACVARSRGAASCATSCRNHDQRQGSLGKIRFFRKQSPDHRQHTRCG